MTDLYGALAYHLCWLGLALDDTGGTAALHENLATLHRHDQDRYLAMLRVFGHAKTLYDVLLTDTIADTCRALGVEQPMLHTTPIFHLMSDRLRIAGGYHGFDAHQDWTALQTSINAVAVWLPFHDVDRACFPLEVLPRSHTRGLLPGVVTNNEYIIDSSCVDDSQFLPVEMAKGDVAFMTMFTVHRTGKSSGDRLRVAASWRYEDAVERSLIERGYPLAQSRVVRHEMFFPGFPDARWMQGIRARLR